MERKTVIVVGAGASREFGLPIGLELQKTISSMLDIRLGRHGVGRSGNAKIIETCRMFQSGDVQAYHEAGRLISLGVGLTDSIDNFLDKHSNDDKVQYMGKLAIAKAISDAELGSSLARYRSDNRSSFSMSEFDKTWLHGLFRNLQRGIHVENVETIFDNVSFVVFNYDRCIEMFLLEALVRAYGIKMRKAADILKRANIYHPYGSLGSLPIMGDVPKDSLRFGGVDYHPSDDLHNIAKRISTYKEEVRDGGELSQAREWIIEADQLVFLGFAFHPQNVKLLSPSCEISARRILGTSFSISEFNQQEIQDSILRSFRSSDEYQLQLSNSTCGDFVAGFERAFY